MKALNIRNAVLLALAATFMVTLGVVWIIYSFYLDATPRIRGEWLEVGRVTLVFTAFTLAAAAAVLGHRRQARWRWPAQAVLVIALAFGGNWLLRLLG